MVRLSMVASKCTPSMLMGLLTIRLGRTTSAISSFRHCSLFSSPAHRTAKGLSARPRLRRAPPIKRCLSADGITRSSLRVASRSTPNITLWQLTGQHTRTWSRPSTAILKRAARRGSRTKLESRFKAIRAWVGSLKLSRAYRWMQVRCNSSSRIFRGFSNSSSSSKPREGHTWGILLQTLSIRSRSQRQASTIHSLARITRHIWCCTTSTAPDIHPRTLAFRPISRRRRTTLRCSPTTLGSRSPRVKETEARRQRRTPGQTSRCSL